MKKVLQNREKSGIILSFPHVRAHYNYARIREGVRKNST